MNPLIEFLIETKGIPETSIILLLTLPIIATIISFVRQIVGIQTFGIYAPILITYAFYQLGLTPNGSDLQQGLKYGFVLVITVFLTASITHDITKKIRLHYLPKMSILLSTASIGVFFLLVFAAYIKRWGFISIDTMPILLMIMVSEQLISTYIKKGKKTAYLLTIGTLFVSSLSYTLLVWDKVRMLVLVYPWISLITILINFIIGRWTGFRLKEYIRFKNLLTQSETD